MKAKQRAQKVVRELLETKTTFDLFNEFSQLYDNSLLPQDSKLLVEYMLNELGYFKPKCGCGWILDKE